MNFNKFTKAELISKLNKNYKNEGNPNLIISIKSYFSQIWNLIITFKSILFKITLFALIIKLIQKHKLIRLVWRIVTGAVMAIFGISTIENFGTEILTHFFCSFWKFLKMSTQNI